MMRGLLVNRDGSTFIGEMPTPKYNEYEALVKMRSGGLCGTDLKILHDKLKGYSDYPAILGHEGVGEVVEIGAKVRKFHIGDIVVMPYSRDDGGKYYATFGAIAEYGIVGDELALEADGIKEGDALYHDYYCAQLKVPKEIDPVSACMITTFREVYSATKYFRFKAGQGIVIYGAGAVGLVFIKFAKLLGLHPIVSVDIDDAKRQQAVKTGADVFINSKECDVVEEIRKLFPNGVEMTLDAAGAVDLMNTSMRITAGRGRICVYGLAPDFNIDLDWSKAPWNWELLFNQWPVKQEEASVHGTIIDMMLKGTLIADDFISDVYAFDESLEAIKLFESRKNNKKIVIKF
jgi:threonine dehydrogenase-like Zn-dependent dehydrogenase